jgi:hypothetical protein
MTVRDTPRICEVVSLHWNEDTQRSLVDRFRLDLTKRRPTSRKAKKRSSRWSPRSPEPDSLVLDEPTSGLDPIVRREFIQTVIGAYGRHRDGARFRIDASIGARRADRRVHDYRRQLRTLTMTTRRHGAARFRCCAVRLGAGADRDRGRADHPPARPAARAYRDGQIRRL